MGCGCSKATHVCKEPSSLALLPSPAPAPLPHEKEEKERKREQEQEQLPEDEEDRDTVVPSPLGKDGTLTEPYRNALVDVFDRFDVNCDGTLNEHEFISLLRTAGGGANDMADFFEWLESALSDDENASENASAPVTLSLDGLDLDSGASKKWSSCIARSRRSRRSSSRTTRLSTTRTLPTVSSLCNDSDDDPTARHEVYRSGITIQVTPGSTPPPPASQDSDSPTSNTTPSLPPPSKPLKLVTPSFGSEPRRILQREEEPAAVVVEEPVVSVEEPVVSVEEPVVSVEEPPIENKIESEPETTLDIEENDSMPQPSLSKKSVRFNHQSTEVSETPGALNPSGRDIFSENGITLEGFLEYWGNRSMKRPEQTLKDFASLGILQKISPRAPTSSPPSTPPSPAPQHPQSSNTPQNQVNQVNQANQEIKAARPNKIVQQQQQLPPGGRRASHSNAVGIPKKDSLPQITSDMSLFDRIILLSKTNGDRVQMQIEQVFPEDKNGMAGVYCRPLRKEMQDEGGFAWASEVTKADMKHNPDRFIVLMQGRERLGFLAASEDQYPRANSAVRVYDGGMRFSAVANVKGGMTKCMSLMIALVVQRAVRGFHSRIILQANVKNKVLRNAFFELAKASEDGNLVTTGEDNEPVINISRAL